MSYLVSYTYRGPADLLWRDRPHPYGEPRFRTMAEVERDRVDDARPEPLIHVCAFSIFAEGPVPTQADLNKHPQSRPARNDFYDELHAAGAVRMMGVAKCSFCEDVFGTWLSAHYPEPKRGPRFQAIVAPALLH
jgi:hypothetical protein